MITGIRIPMNVMEPYFLPFVVLTILNKFYGVLCLVNNERFSHGKYYDRNVCADDNVIESSNYISKIRCLTRCSSDSSCHGVFIEEATKRCVTCSARFFTQNATTGSKFYKRYESTDVSSYLLVTQPMTWHTAKQHCEDLGGHLLIITSEEENGIIVSYLYASVPSNTKIYIGGIGTGGRAETFKWVDGSTISDGYTNWYGGQPYPVTNEERYIEMIKEWGLRWNDAKGVYQKYSVCEFE